jgi:hypothetical protein
MGSLIINEFELVPAHSGRNGALEDSAMEAEPAAEQAVSGQSPVHETERILRWRSERLLRVWAH